MHARQGTNNIKPEAAHTESQTEHTMNTHGDMT